MKTIRKGVFETNSSSTHSICICTDEEFNAWADKKLFWDKYEETFITIEEVIHQLREGGEEGTDEELTEKILENPSEFELDTLDTWGEDYENDHNIYTTKSGETLHILCYYGYNY